MTQTDTRARTTGRPVRDRPWFRWGAIVLAADLVVHNTGGGGQATAAAGPLRA